MNSARLLCVLIVTSAGCNAAAAGGTGPVRAGANGGLPAYETEAERRAKADGVDDERDEATYGYTEAPGDVWYLPGEFESADSMLVGWAGRDAWEGRLVAAALPYIKVRVVTPSQDLELVRGVLTDLGVDEDAIGRIDWITEQEVGGNAILDTVWMRDYGPLVPITNEYGHRLVDFRYYGERLLDDALPTRLGNYWGLPVSRPQMELEGGNIQANGSGTCVVSRRAVEQNLAAFGENFGEDYVKDTLRDYLACQTTVIVPRLEREGTGHVDMYVHLTGTDTALVGEYTTDQDEANKAVTDEGAQILTDAGFTVTRVPMPTPDGTVFRSYTNALAINDAVLVPVYPSDTAGEETALDAFRAAYPNREIVTLDADQIIRAGGAIHCTTMSIGNVPE